MGQCTFKNCEARSVKKMIEDRKVSLCQDHTSVWKTTMDTGTAEQMLNVWTLAHNE